MHITLDMSLFERPSDEEQMALAELFLNVARDTTDLHAVLSDPGYLPGNAHEELDTWLGSRPNHEARAFRNVLNQGPLRARGPRNAEALDSEDPPRSYLPGLLRIRVERREASDWRARKLTLTDALDLLREPLHLILENARNDQSFVLHLADPTNRKMLRSLLEKPGLTQSHGGGAGEGKKWIEALLVGEPTPTHWRRMLRAWVLFDQDAGEHDACTPSESAVALMSLCQKVVEKYGPGLSWICLRRREIESYVPNTWLLVESTEMQKMFVHHVIAWRARDDRKAWAWAVDFKKGLFGDLLPDWSKGLPKADIEAIKAHRMPLEARMLKAPFHALSTTEIQEMRSGLGKNKLNNAFLQRQEMNEASQVSEEYDRGPADQVPRLTFVQSIFDRM